MKSDYKRKDFVNCLFNPMCDGMIINEYPALEPIKCEDKLMRYIIMIYSKESPLIKREQNINYRKEVAAELAGFDLSTDYESLLTIYDCSNEHFLSRVLLYIKTFEKSRLWSKICTNEQLFEEYTRRLMQPVKSDDKEKDEMSAIQTKAKLRQELNSIDDDLDAFYQRLYEVDDQLEKAVKKRGVSPQNIDV